MTRRIRTSKSLAGLLLASLLGCSEDSTPPDVVEPAAQTPRFEEISEAVGLLARHELGSATLEQAGALAPLLGIAGGVAIADVDGDGSDDVLVLGGDHGAQLFIHDAGGFVESAEEYGLELGPYASGPVFGDVDGDGLVDLVVANVLTGAVELWTRDAARRFVRAEAAFDVPDEFGPALAVAVGDVDRDQDLDLFVARWATDSEGAPHLGSLWINDGTGRFEDHSHALEGLLEADVCGGSDFGVLSPQFADVLGGRRDPTDGLLPALDRYPELLLARVPGPNLVLLNTSTESDAPSFEPSPARVVSAANPMLDAEIPWSATSAFTADLDSNGLEDWVLLGNGEPTCAAPVEDAGALVDAGAPVDANVELPSASVVDTGDAGVGQAPDASAAEVPVDVLAGALERWSAFGGFEDQILLRGADEARDDGVRPARWEQTKLEPAGPRTWGGCSADFDADGRLDLLLLAEPTSVADAGAPGGIRLLLRRVLENAADWVDLSGAAGFADAAPGRVAVCFDYDGDGDVDVLTWRHGGPTRLYRNTLREAGNPTTSIAVRVEASDDLALVQGTRVVVRTATTWGLQVVHANRGHLAQGSNTLIFGTRGQETAEVTLVWPDGATETVIPDVPTNDTYTIRRKPQ